MSKSKKVIIHPGFHKTGTTALQHALSASRRKLREAGYFYPHQTGKAHHQAAWSIIEKTWGWQARGGRLVAPAEWLKLERKIKRVNEVSIISSEFLSEANSEQLSHLASRLKGYEVQVVFTWRPLPFLLASSYQQYLKYGVKSSYEKWLTAIFETPGESKLTPSFWKRNLHGDVIAAWCGAFGTENVSVIAVDESQPNFLYESFASVVNIPAGLIKEPVNKEINRSLTFSEAALLLEINKTYPKDRNWNTYQIFIRRGNIKALTSSNLVEESDQKFLTPEWALTKAISINKNSVEKIKSLGIKIIGDIDRSDFSRIPVGTNKPVTEISIKTAARAMVGVDMESLKRMRGSDVSREFFARLRSILKQRLHLRRLFKKKKS